MPNDLFAHFNNLIRENIIDNTTLAKAMDTLLANPELAKLHDEHANAQFNFSDTVNSEKRQVLELYAQHANVTWTEQEADREFAKLRSKENAIVQTFQPALKEAKKVVNQTGEIFLQAFNKELASLGIDPQKAHNIYTVYCEDRKKRPDSSIIQIDIQALKNPTISQEK